jgi:hypothetical protein
LIQEAKAKFLANFKVNRNKKVVRQRARDLASLRPTTTTPEVSDTNELQSLKNYIDEQREQMQNIIGGMQKYYRRLVRAFDKSTIANFPLHEVELEENTRDSSATGSHDQSQPLYGMPIDTYLGQPQLPTQIGDIFADLHMSRPSARERGPSRPAAAGPIFNELPTHAPEPPRTAQTLNYPVERSAYSDGRSIYHNGCSGRMAGQSTHIVEWSAYLTGRSDTEFFDEDCYPNPHPSRLNVPSYPIAHQHHNTTFQTHGVSTFRPMEGRKETVVPMSCIGPILIRHKTQTNGGEDNMPISKQRHPCQTKESVVSH